ncbi:expressed unknown protein [Seminavis robusta]|uniref:F-box domain-containing protein n=1 Tax=Seminavis robusta TaxID=568900 RepID=A0A9N8DQV4_9STRA|nr:expressed unknown protein [Seminavis robusta]|eukprot:Sro287_g108600.1 n/a (471) ;mRNA; r:36722-38214
MDNALLDLPAVMKVRIASFLSPQDAISFSRTCKVFYDDLSMTTLPMRIPYKSWYDDDLQDTTAVQWKRGPKIPFLPHRTHSVTLTGSWSCRLGELQGRHYGANSHAQFYIVAYPLEHATRGNTPDIVSRKLPDVEDSDTAEGGDSRPSWLRDKGGRIVWASQPLCQRYYHPSNSNSSWVKMTVTFIPSKEEEYFLCIQPGPGSASQQQWWRHSLHMSNLIAHITYHDNPHTNFLMKRQYKTVVRHMLMVDNRGAYYTKILEAVARSIRIQLARFGRNALDPVLESFFQSTGIPRDTDSLLVLEEIARFLSHYAYVNERQKKYNNSNTERDSAKGGSSSNRESIPDWVPYAESSVANKSSRDLSHSHTDDLGVRDEREPVRASPAIATVMEQDGSRPRRTSKRIQKTMKSLWRLPSSLWRAGGGKGRKSRRGHRPSWRTDELTEEFSISVAPQELERVADQNEEQRLGAPF